MASISNSPFSCYLNADSLNYQFAIIMKPKLRLFSICHFHAIHMQAVFILISLLSCYLCSGNPQFTILKLSSWMQYLFSILNSLFSSYLHTGSLYSQFTIIMLHASGQSLFSINHSNSACYLSIRYYNNACV